MKSLRFLIFAALVLGLASTGCEKVPPVEPTPGNAFQLDPLGGDKRDKVIGTYPVRLTTPVSLASELYADMLLELEGANHIKASGEAEVAGGVLSVAVTLVDLKEFNNVDGIAATGYYFNVPEREFEMLGFKMMLSATGHYDGYDGMVYRIRDWNESYFVCEVGHENGNFNIQIETGVEE